MNTYSRIIAGCMSWGAWGKQMSTQEMIAQIHTTAELGITSFDHADIYGDYTTEAAFGKAFSESGLERESVQLISKCGIQNLGITRNNKVKHYNYSKDYILKSVDSSLRNLQTDYLDLLLLHRPSPLMNSLEISEAVHQLKEEGKILDFGVSNFTPSQMSLVNSITPISVNQIEFSLTQHEAMYNGTLDYLYEQQLTVMSWSPLGTFFKESSEANIRTKEVLQALTRKYKATEDQLLLAWILKHPSRIHPVVGTTEPKRLENAVKATTIHLELEDWFEMLLANQGHKVP